LALAADKVQDKLAATGRRKRAVARVRLALGTGEIKINDKPIEAYLGRQSLLQIVRQPLELTNSTSRFNVSVTAHGGGLAGQAGAIRHGIARALVGMDESLRPLLRRAGLLTRDPREKESKKYGRARARKRFQFSKR
jgi:small subunit ribosomal protein S9